MIDPPVSRAPRRRRDVLRLTVLAGLGATGAARASRCEAAPAATGATLDVDVAKIPPGSGVKLAWHGQPVFIRHLTPAEVATVQAEPIADLRDPQTLDERTRPGHRDWLVVIAVCPHLGCMPLGIAPGEPRGSFGGFVCPCHGSQFDAAGRVRAGPSPSNLEVPAYRFDGGHILRLGE